MSTTRSAVAVGLVLLLGACSSSSRSSTPTTTAAVTTVPTTSTTAGPAPTTVPARDPLPAGTVMLGGRANSVVALDADGHELATLTSAAPGRIVTGIQLMPDHEKLWYVTTGDPTVANHGCPDVLTMNLRTNVTSVIAHAFGVAVTADGRRYVLGPGVYSDAGAREGCPADFEDELAVHDRASGAVSHAPQSGAPIASSGPLGVAISPAGDRLVTSQCSLDGCGVLTLAVPKALGAPLVWSTSNASSCSCRNFVTEGDALYAVVDTPMAPRGALRRFAWDTLSGSGTNVFRSADPNRFSTPVPTSAGLYAFVGDEYSAKTSHLYRLSGSRATVIGASGYAAMVGVPPFRAK